MQINDKIWSRYNMKNKIGFTLPELWVGVLVIGLLAAVALPQYQRVVTHAHNAEAVMVLRTVGRGIELYDLANGPLPEEKSGDFSILDVTVKDTRYWSYYFHCYDEFKSCFVSAHPKQRDIAVGEHEYFLMLHIDLGRMHPAVEVRESVLVSQEEQEDGSTVSIVNSSNASPQMCKQAGGKMSQGRECLLE